jgi:hypothetical protein
VETTISEGWSTGEGSRLSEQRDRRVPEIKGTMTSESPTRLILGNFFTSRSLRRFFFNKIDPVLGILTREVPRTRVVDQNRLWLHWLLSQMRPKKLSLVQKLPVSSLIFDSCDLSFTCVIFLKNIERKRQWFE